MHNTTINRIGAHYRLRLPHSLTLFPAISVGKIDVYLRCAERRVQGGEILEIVSLFPCNDSWQAYNRSNVTRTINQNPSFRRQNVQPSMVVLGHAKRTGGGTMGSSQHSGDCSIYSALINGCPDDGVCTCGYGRSLLRQGDISEMYSQERIDSTKPKVS